MRNSLPLASDMIIIKSSPGAAVYPDQLTSASTAANVSMYLILFASNFTSVKAFQCAAS